MKSKILPMVLPQLDDQSKCPEKVPEYIATTSEWRCLNPPWMSCGWHVRKHGCKEVWNTTHHLEVIIYEGKQLTFPALVDRRSSHRRWKKKLSDLLWKHLKEGLHERQSRNVGI